MDALLCGVGNFEGFDDNNNLIVSAKVLTDSSINMAVDNAEARGGQGNILVGKYYFGTSFGMTLTDQIWNMNYLSLNCGGSISAGADVMKLEQVTVGSGGSITVTGTPTNFTSTSGIIGWIKKSTDDDTAYTKITFSGQTATTTLTSGTVACVKYVVNSDSARKFVVNADFIPSVIHGKLTIGLFKAGTTKETLSSSSKIGDLVVDVPKFQLEGNVTLDLTASGIATVPLSGSALATFGGDSGCNDHGYYATIVEHFYNMGEFDNVERIVIGDSNIELSATETQTIDVYAMYSDGTQPKLLDNSKLTFTSGTTATATVGSHTGLVTAVASGTSNIEVVVTDSNYSNLNAYAVVTVS
jgi:hypothetical protein